MSKEASWRPGEVKKSAERCRPNALTMPAWTRVLQVREHNRPKDRCTVPPMCCLLALSIWSPAPRRIPKRGSSLSPRPSQPRAARSAPPPPSHACTSPPLLYMLRLNTSETSVSPPCRNLKGLAREVTGPCVLSGTRCHGLKFLARIRAKLGSRSCVLSSHPLPKGRRRRASR